MWIVGTNRAGQTGVGPKVWCFINLIQPKNREDQTWKERLKNRFGKSGMPS